MKVEELASVLKNARIIGNKDAEITSLCIDSRLCKEGSVFFCFVGEKNDSHLFIKEAEERGATAVVCERDEQTSLVKIITDDSRRAMSLMACAFYGNPTKKLKLIGITGTNGKTTTSYMLASILRRAGKNVGVIGTLGIRYGKKKIAPSLTTPDPVYLQETLADMVKDGVEYVVAEISAHALYFEKDAGIFYSACIFTNFTQDHLDFFKTMKEYKRAKKRLFTAEKCPIAFINGDDPFGREIGKEREGVGAQTVYYGLKTPADCFAVITKESIRETECMLNLSDLLCKVRLPMLGEHNLYNALAAASCAVYLGVSEKEVSEGLTEMEQVDGRLEYVESFRGASIFVDFAHTPDGLEKSLTALKRFCEGKLICVFGCGGNRDREKRPLMGETVAKLADFSILTSDNPRYEDPMDILAEIEKGYKKISNRYAVVPERAKATGYALGLLGEGDVLILAGKGGETTQEIMGIKYDYNDKATIKDAVERLKNPPQK